ncbi:MAG: hypothetical protein WC480_04770 [Patescibacteria group bacterium]
MLSDNNNRRVPEENIKIVSRCPMCSSYYNPLDAKVLDQRDNASLVYIRCHQCQCSILALILSTPLGINTVGLVTDLTPEEVTKYKSVEDISEDDVLEIYQLLQKNENMLKLLS